MKLSIKTKRKIIRAVQRTDYNSNKPKIAGYKMYMSTATTPNNLKGYLVKLELGRATTNDKYDQEASKEALINAICD